MIKLVMNIGGSKVDYFLEKDGSREYSFLDTKRMYKDELLDEIANFINSLDENLDIKISSPTAVDKISGYCRGISAIPEYENFNLYTELKSRLKKESSITALNDAKCGLLGIIEKEFNAKPESALMISLGSGVGGAIYMNGEIWNGVDNMAGEIGYPIWKGKLNVSHSLSPMNILNNYFYGLEGEEVFSKYLKDKKITEKINEWIKELSKFVAMMSFTLNTQYIVFTGPITKNKTFQMVMLSMYENFLEENNINLLLSTKIQFFQSNINYKLEGANIL